MPAHGQQIDRICAVAFRIVRLQLQAELEFPLGALPVPVVAVEDAGERSVSFSEHVVQGQRLPYRRLRFRHALPRRLETRHIEQAVGIG